MTSNEYKAKVIHLLRRLIRKKITVALSDCGLSANNGVYFQKSRQIIFWPFLNLNKGYQKGQKYDLTKFFPNISHF